MNKISKIIVPTAIALLLISLLMGCSTTQKTAGQGMISVAAQNVVRIAGKEAFTDVDLTEVKDRNVTVLITGFSDEFSSGFIENLSRNALEASGGKLVGEAYAELIVEVAVNAAGNDLAGNSYIVGGSARSEGTVDLTITIRNNKTGDRLSRQQIVGFAKYQQGTFLGIVGSGAYFVLRNDRWELVDDPTYY